MRIGDLEPREVWVRFEELCAIPRPSGDEGRAADHVQAFAESRGLEFLRDGADNVLIRKPARGPGRVGNPPLALQAHLDMVPEKTGSSSHDFHRDPIRPVIDGDWVTSPDTTLGADNGIGVAVMLAILDSEELPHPPLECIFTTDEERGLTGASSLDPGWITARRMINLDSEDLDVFTIGCAGGADHVLRTRIPLTKGRSCVPLSVRGLRGGHSGIEIDGNRGNAIRFLARALGRINCGAGIQAGYLWGGSKRNAIPREAGCMVAVPEDDGGRLGEEVLRLEKELRLEYSGIEDSIRVELGGEASDAPVMAPEQIRRVTDLLLSLPHGVEKMSGSIPGLVETSVNLAVLSMDGEDLAVQLSVRSPLSSARNALGERIHAAARLAGFSAEKGGEYPGWMPDTGSRLLERMKSIYTGLFGREPEVLSIHAGLECGIIGDRVGGMEMISIGPDIRDVHVPGEKVSISSLRKFWEFISAVLAGIDGTERHDG
ncbi:MAG: hypothetical protein AVO35_03045 [Candidatus Aegiribacteria sp. MLS_C]|nr:MAG: hypothetical protein AVO35_03045 [Candidatus Aegiribacteria sp. MLS_C]